MSPRGGGGGSSGGGGRSGGGSVSSSSASKGSSLSGTDGRSGSSGIGSTRPSYSGSSKGGKGSKSPSYFGSTNGGSGRKRPLGGNAHNSCDDDDSDDDDACPYTSAAIPSKNNPFSFLSRRAHVQPRDQSQNVFEDIKELAAFENHLLFESPSTGYQNGMDAAQMSPKYDPRTICQAPYGSKCKVLLCGVASDPVPFFLVLVLLFLLGTICFTSSKERAHHERSRKAKENAKTTYESHTEGIKVMHIEFADSSEAEDTKTAVLADVETATSNVEMEEPVEGCEKPCEFIVW
ncbi:MAG: hypothetical protein L6R38_006281 [Xanthoria sp. 2 TBL-2021]|nr:MAG: hypothetical protein L6R38_006281 [Xanthoria sp. 2 TBL-2021]